MSGHAEAYLGDDGTAIVLNCGEDISDGTAFSIEALKPDGSTAVSWSASLNGIDSVRTVAAVLDVVGRWRLQAKVTTPDGEWRGKTATLTVLALFD